VPLTLNKQIITLLSQLGVPDTSFFGLLNDEIKPFIFGLIEPSTARKTISELSPKYSNICLLGLDLTEHNFARQIIITKLLEKLGENRLIINLPSYLYLTMHENMDPEMRFSLHNLPEFSTLK
jgi:hypothetical protein